MRKDATKTQGCEGERAESHAAHMELNNECPWCGMYTPDEPLVTEGMTDEQAVAFVVSRHG